VRACNTPWTKVRGERPAFGYQKTNKKKTQKHKQANKPSLPPRTDARPQQTEQRDEQRRGVLQQIVHVRSDLFGVHALRALRPSEPRRQETDGPQRLIGKRLAVAGRFGVDERRRKVEAARISEVINDAHAGREHIRHQKLVEAFFDERCDEHIQ
jgi:hypothetical protein